MEHRMSIRIPTQQPVTIKAGISGPIYGELRDVSFDGAFLIPAGPTPQALLEKRVRVLVNAAPAAGTTPVEIPARVVRAKADGVGLAFDGYDQVANEYLERIYSERLRRTAQTDSL